jgi:hypothetical protein
MPEDKARKRAVRARMAETGERYTTAARKLGADRPADPPVAEREWSTRARVRIVTAARAGSVAWHDVHQFTPGEELEMIQWGRAGRPVERDCWWSSTDIDGAYIIDAGHVEVLEVIAESAPTFAGAALPAAKVTAMFGDGAAGWPELGILTVPSVYDLEIRAGSGELLGLIERGGQGAAYADPHPAEPVTYRAVIREDGSYHPPAVKFPAGFIPPDPARATAAERARWGGTGTGTADGVHAAVRRGEPAEDG